jgi:hypothetical protein
MKKKMKTRQRRPKKKSPRLKNNSTLTLSLHNIQVS